MFSVFIYFQSCCTLHVKHNFVLVLEAVTTKKSVLFRSREASSATGWDYCRGVSVFLCATNSWPGNFIFNEKLGSALFTFMYFLISSISRSLKNCIRGNVEATIARSRPSPKNPNPTNSYNNGGLQCCIHAAEAADYVGFYSSIYQKKKKKIKFTQTFLFLLGLCHFHLHMFVSITWVYVNASSLTSVYFCGSITPTLTAQAYTLPGQKINKHSCHPDLTKQKCTSLSEWWV